jgi:hypothetical protein
MPVPSAISDLNTVASANSPQGTESAKGTIDDYLRAHAAFIAQLNVLVAGATVTLASNATVAIGAANSTNVAITGTTTITAFDTVAEGVLRWVVFTGALTLTHNGASLALPGAANIVTAAGDAALFKSLGAGNWKCIDFQPVSGNVTVAGIGAALAGKTVTGALTVNGQLLLKDGSAASPSVSFATDGALDTGFYHIGDGIIGITCNGTAVGSISSTGISTIKITQTA